MSTDLKERIARIRATVSLPDLLLSYGVQLRQTGDGYSAKCISPAHDDKNPSMSIYRAENFAGFVCYCHTCGFGNDVIDAYQALTGVSNMEAIAALEGNDYEGRKYAGIKDEPPLKVVVRDVYPPPDDAPPPQYRRANYKRDDGEWVSMGDPVAIFCYKTPEGKPWYYEARYMVNNKKEPRCWTWGNRGQQPARWELGFPPAPRPLYGLDEIANAQQVLVCEGPRKAEAARTLLGDVTSVACVGWAGGANGVKHSDWSPLNGKQIVLLPDADDVGRAAMEDVASRVNASKLMIVDVSEMPDGWDTADAIFDGWDKERFLAFLKAHKREYAAPESEPALEHEPIPELPSPPVEAYVAEGKVVNQSVPVDNPAGNYDEQANNPYPTDWPEPIDIFNNINLPQVKEYMLPECIADWCMDTAGVMGVDPVLLALPAIVAAAAMLHDEIQVQPIHNDPSWRESARLWGAVVGVSSSMKTPATGRALTIVKKIDAECNEKEGRLRYEHSLNERAHKTLELAYIEKLSKGDKTAQMPAKLELPTIYRAIAQDFTIEALRDILKHSTRGILAERDELSGWFGSMDAYKRGGGSDRAAWLETYNGGSRRIDRVGSGSVFVKNWSACIIGGIQPDTMREIAGDLQEDGLLQRFMVVYGRSAVKGNKQAPNKHINERYREVIRQIWDTQPADHGTVHFSEAANAIRESVADYAFELIGLDFVSTAMTAHLGKWGGLFARLSLTFHAIECADRHVHPQSCEISEDTAKKVKAFMIDLLLPHATSFYLDIMGGSQLSKQVNGVANLILAKKYGELTLSDINKGWPSWKNISEQLQATVINRLIDSNWIVPAPGARTYSKRQLATRYLVNPTLHDVHAVRAEKERERQLRADEIYRDVQNR